MAVVAAGELDDDIPPGVAARDADGAHGRLGAGRHHADHLDGRDAGDDALGQLALALGRRAETRPPADGLLGGRDDARVGVAEDERPPGVDVVEVAVAIEVEQVRPLAACDEQRLAADRPEGAGGAVDPSGDEAGRSLERRSTADADWHWIDSRGGPGDTDYDREERNAWANRGAGGTMELHSPTKPAWAGRDEIGRASCRERVLWYV